MMPSMSITRHRRTFPTPHSQITVCTGQRGAASSEHTSFSDHTYAKATKSVTPTIPNLDCNLQQLVEETVRTAIQATSSLPVCRSTGHKHAGSLDNFPPLALYRSGHTNGKQQLPKPHSGMGATNFTSSIPHTQTSPMSSAGIAAW